MRFCNRCRKFTVGEPVFCTFCGSTYDVKLCSRHHPNPRYAEICSQCGSREMSSPHPKIPVLIRPVLWLVVALPRILCILLALGVAVVVIQWLLTDREGQQLLLLLILIAIPPILVWRWLPPFAKKIFRGSFNFASRLCFPRKDTRRRM